MFWGHEIYKNNALNIESGPLPKVKYQISQELVEGSFRYYVISQGGGGGGGGAGGGVSK